MGKLFVLIAATLLAGCASQELWSKPGASDRDFQVSLARCRMGNASAYGSAPRDRTPGDGLISAGQQIGYIRNCLIADGWEPQRQ